MAQQPMRRFVKVLSRFAFALSVLGIQGCSTNPELSDSAEPVLLLANVAVIDSVHGVRQAQAIVVRGNTIVKVGDVHDVHVPKGARVIDGRGKYVIPGLWDAHVHLAVNPALGADTWYPLLIANGVTSVIDMGAHLDKILPLRDAAHADAMAPRIFLAGPLIDGPQPLYPAFSVGVGNIAEARAEIDSLKAAGVDVVRLYEMLPPTVFKDAVRYAHERGVSVGGHVPFFTDALDVAVTGIDSLEHLRGFETACSTDWSKLLSERRTTWVADRTAVLNRYRTISLAQRNLALQSPDEARCELLVAALVANGVAQVPALASLSAPSTHFYASSEWRATFDYIPASVRKDWLSAGANSSASSESPQNTAYADWAVAMVAKLNKHGAKFMAGTDGPAAYLTPGFGLHQELVALVAAGLTPMAALAASTSQPAQFTRLQDKLGTIEEGKWADMVLLDANPLDDIRNTQKIAAVIKDGRVYDRAALDSMLTALKIRNAE